MTSHPLTAELVTDGHRPKQPAVSPDGRWVAYVVAPRGRTGGLPADELWLAAIDGSTTRRLGTGHTLPRWTPDSTAVHVLADETRAVHRVDLDGATSALTAWPAGIADHVPLADGTVALLAPDEPGGAARLRLLDPRSGAVHTPDVGAGRHVVAVAQRPDGGPLAVLTHSTPDVDPGDLDTALHVLDLTTGTTRELGPARVEAAAPAWWRDGDGWRLVHLGLTPPGLVGGYAVFDGDRNLTADWPGCPVELVGVARGAPLVVVADGLDTTIRRLGTTASTRCSGAVSSLAANEDGSVVAAVVSTAYAAEDVWAGPLAGPLARCGDTRPELRSVRWGAQRRLSYRAADGLPLDGLVIEPPQGTGPFPLVTLVHGGPYGRYADALMADWARCGQWLAAGGYAVFLPNPRGGMGHGHEFAARVAGAVGGAEWTDILTGIDLLVADGVADPDRLGIDGWSHGGFMAAWAVGHTDRFRAAIVGAGVTDWGLLAATGENGRFEAALAGTPPEPHNPITYAAAIRTPVLVLHSDADTNVPIAQADTFVRALARHGVTHEFVRYPRENHSLAERDHQLDVLRRSKSWFDRWL